MIVCVRVCMYSRSRCLPGHSCPHRRELKETRLQRMGVQQQLQGGREREKDRGRGREREGEREREREGGRERV